MKCDSCGEAKCRQTYIGTFCADCLSTIIRHDCAERGPIESVRFAATLGIPPGRFEEIICQPLEDPAALSAAIQHVLQELDEGKSGQSPTPRN